MNIRASNSMTYTSAIIDHSFALSGRVLDAGCGAMPYKRLNFPDVSEWVGLDNREGVGDVDGDVCDIPLDDEQFDAVMCVDALQYVPDPARALREFYRVLKPGGSLLLIVPNNQEDDRSAFWGFRAEGVRYLLAQADFDVDILRVASRQFACEYENTKLSKYGFAIPPEINSFVQRLDDAYPHICVAVGKKG